MRCLVGSAFWTPEQKYPRPMSAYSTLDGMSLLGRRATPPLGRLRFALCEMRRAEELGMVDTGACVFSSKMIGKGGGRKTFPSSIEGDEPKRERGKHKSRALGVGKLPEK